MLYVAFYNIILRKQNNVKIHDKLQSFKPTYQFGWLSFSLGLNDLLLTLLNSLLNHEGCTLSLLRCNLLGFDGCWVLGRKRKLGDGNVVQNDVEIQGTLDQTFADKKWNLLALCDQLRGIELGNNSFQNLKFKNLAPNPVNTITSLQIDGKTRSSQFKPRVL